MFLHALLVATFALGHLALIVLAVNISHGIGFRSSRTEPLTVVALAVVGVATLAVGWWTVGHGFDSWPLALRLYAAACWFTALVGLPTVELARRLGKDRDSVRTESVEQFDLSATIEPGASSPFFRIPRNESSRLLVRDCRVLVPGLPEALEGLSIVHLTDLHMSPAYGRRYFEAVADQAARLEPDLVLCTGDVVEHDESIAWVVPVLGRVQGRLGQFSILGNHDDHHHPERIRGALGEAGFEDVEGRWSLLKVEGESLAIGGTAAPWGPPLPRESMPEASARLVLSHTPDQFYRVAAWRAVDLMLCGHNHGGQVRLPGLGPVLMPSRFSRRFDRGFFRSGRTLMYVGQGIGAKHPIRWNCPPEVTRLVLVGTPTAGPFRARGSLAARARV